MKSYRKGISAYKKASKGFVKTGDTDTGSGDSGGLGAANSAGQDSGEAAGGAGNTADAANAGWDKRSTGRKAAVPAGNIKSGVERASKFLMLLEKDNAAKVMQHLSPEELEAVSKKIAETGRIDSEEAKRILTEFGLIREKGETHYGGPDVARSMLVNAFGEEKGEKLFKKAVPYGGNKPFAFLNDYEFQQILMILKKEPPAVLAIVMQYLEPATASKVLESLSPDVQKSVVKHIAGMEKIDSEVLARMEDVIKEKILKQGKVVTEEIDGKSVLADILKHVGAAAEEEILHDLEASDPGLSEEIRDKLFGIDTIQQLHDKDLQEVLRDYDDGELAFILKGKPDGFREKILGNVSERRREIIENEIAFLGSVKRGEVDKTTKEFLRYLQNQVEEGKLRIFRDGDSEIYL